MLHKIKILSVASLLILSYQTTLFTMDTNQNNLKEEDSDSSSFYSFLEEDSAFESFSSSSEKEEEKNNLPSNHSVAIKNCAQDNKPLNLKKYSHETRQGIVSLFKKRNLPSRGYVPAPEKTIINYMNLTKDSIYDKTNLKEIKTKLTSLIKFLKQEDLKDELFQAKDVALCKHLWDDFLALHNYSLLDRILYPSQPDIESPEEARYRRESLKPLHPDKQSINHIKNSDQKDDLYKYICNQIRPEKSMDFILDPIVEMALRIPSKVISQTQFQIVDTLCCLPFSLLFKEHFQSYYEKKVIIRNEMSTRSIKKENMLYDKATKKHINESKNHDIAIKKTELRIAKEQLVAKILLKSLDPKK